MMSRAMRRIHADMKELRTEPSDMYSAAPREDDFLDWHFTLRGPPGSDFDGGIYHGRILLPHDYPFAPPSITFMTPNGRFELNKKICLSISAYHPEEWQPAWGIRTILEALISFFPTKGDGAIGALDWTKSERQKLVPQSRVWRCPHCGKKNEELVPELKVKACDRVVPSKYAAQIAQMHIHKAPEAQKEDEKSQGGNEGSSKSGLTEPQAIAPATQADAPKEAAGIRRRQTTKDSGGSKSEPEGRSIEKENVASPPPPPPANVDSNDAELESGWDSSESDSSYERDSGEETEYETTEERLRREWNEYAARGETSYIRMQRHIHGPPKKTHWTLIWAFYFFSAVVVAMFTRRWLRTNGYAYI